MMRLSYIIATLILIGFVASTRAQEVSIPDAGLNAAIREALNKPIGPLTEQDLLTLTNLNPRQQPAHPPRFAPGLDRAGNPGHRQQCP